MEKEIRVQLTEEVYKHLEEMTAGSGMIRSQFIAYLIEKQAKEWGVPKKQAVLHPWKGDWLASNLRG